MREFASRGGLPLAKTPSRRQQAARRRWMLVAGFLALALAAGAIGSMTTHRGEVAAPRGETGPFSYFPSQ